MSLNSRVTELEKIMAEHLKESGSIQTNLKWNTLLTGGIAAALLVRLVVEYLFSK